jgi:hypothetical protein
MIFVHPAPGAIGKVDYSYTNNTENGPPPRTIMDRLIFGLMFTVGLFLIEVLAYAALQPSPDAFLPGLALCFVVGHIVGWVWPKPKILTLYCGDQGAAWIQGEKIHVLLFAELQALEDMHATFQYKGITTLHRELRATGRDGKRRTWFVGAARDIEAAEDARYNFCSVVLDHYQKSR